MLSKILCTPSGEESIFGVQITSDGTTAADNFAALQSFFEKFPEYTTNDFYVAGESYGGFYVPTLSLTIFKAGATFKGSMKGFLVGNGVFVLLMHHNTLLCSFWCQASSVLASIGEQIYHQDSLHGIVVLLGRDVPVMQPRDFFIGCKRGTWS
eukprot:m.664663 g.664663  ORF g.664663 m.664663 type:complete len:153 (-) comp22747_c0_seq2:3964-4422(-)